MRSVNSHAIQYLINVTNVLLYEDSSYISVHHNDRLPLNIKMVQQLWTVHDVTSRSNLLCKRVRLVHV
jgi:hypothetical protein